VYRVDFSYDNCCIRVSNDKILFVNKRKLYDQLKKNRDDNCLYNFFKKDYKVDDELIVKYVIYFSYKNL